MTHRIQYFLAMTAVLIISCKNDQQTNRLGSGETPVFAKGNRITNANFTGTAYLKMLVDADSLNSISVGNVTFEPAARSKWHTHPTGQILLAIDGVGYYQEKGKPKQILRKGDAVKCPPDTPHWHGASMDSAFVQVAITGREKGETVWLDAVNDEEYNSGTQEESL